MGVSLNKLLCATAVHIVMLILLRLSCSNALDVETHTPDKTNHSKGENFAANCSIEIHGEELEEIIESDGDMQLGVKMLDCKRKRFVPNAVRTVPGNLHQCLNISSQNISCNVLKNGNRLYMLTWVVIPGNYLSNVQNYSFSCHDVNNFAVPRNCPARAFDVSVIEQTTTEGPPHRDTRNVRSHSLRYTTPSTIHSTVTATATTPSVTVADGITTPEKVKDHSTTNSEKKPTNTVENMDTAQIDGVGAFGNGAGRIMWHPFTLSELFLCVMLVELLTRR